MGSPPGGSSRTTSAPSSPSRCPASGPCTLLVTSTTRSPASGAHSCGPSGGRAGAGTVDGPSAQPPRRRRYGREGVGGAGGPYRKDADAAALGRGTHSPVVQRGRRRPRARRGSGHVAVAKRCWNGGQPAATSAEPAPSSVQKHRQCSASSVSISKRTPSAERKGGTRYPVPPSGPDVPEPEQRAEPGWGPEPDPGLGSAVAAATYWVRASSAAWAAEVSTARAGPPRSRASTPAVTAWTASTPAHPEV